MTNDPLPQPIGFSARGLEVLSPEDSIGRAATLLRNTTAPAVAVADGNHLVGVVGEEELRGILASGTDPNSAVKDFAKPCESLPTSATGAEALRKLESDGLPWLLVLDLNQYPIGFITPSDLFPREMQLPRPHLVGGMATPLGVYLTTGGVAGGAGHLGLILSGMTLVGLFLMGNTVSYLIAESMPEGQLADAVMVYLPFVLFLLGLRAIPMAGIHAAEHQVVHALERDEPLVPEVVARMPRVHPRCGTNLTMGAAIFTTILFSAWYPDEEVRFLVAVLATFVLWRPVGSFMQWAVTTRKANRKQLESGIKAANELLANYRKNRRSHVSPLQRILYSGILHVLLGGFIVSSIAYAIGTIFNLPFLL